MADVERERVTALWREAAAALEASPDELMGPGWRSGFWDEDEEPCAECGRLREQLDAAERARMLAVIEGADALAHLREQLDAARQALERLGSHDANCAR